MVSSLEGAFGKAWLWELLVKIDAFHFILANASGNCTCLFVCYQAMGTLSLNKYDLFTKRWQSAFLYRLTRRPNTLLLFPTSTLSWPTQIFFFPLPSLQLRVNLSSPLCVAHSYSPFSVETFSWMSRKPDHRRPSQLFSQAILGPL